MSYTTTATATNSTGNTILVESTDNLFSGLPIVFSGVAFGGIIAGAAYYVGTVDYEYNLITVSTLPGGTAFILTTGTGSMTATFTQGGQQIIDTDPPGVPLNTAFNDTNLNFDQIFAAGPVGSNIQIKDNTISTINTNGNIVLKPNGVGVVQSKVNIVPDSTRIRNLGAPTARWLNIYGWNANIASNVSIGGAIDISGPANIGGDMYVDGNLTVEGTTTTIDSTVVDIKDKNITLAFGSPNAQVANGGGITIAGANAQMYYNYAGNNWTFNLPVATANIQFPDGSVLNTGNTVHIGQAPINKGNGNLWFNSDDGRGYIKYNNQWIEFCPPIIPNPATYLGNLTIDGEQNSTLYFPPGGAIVFGDDTVQDTAYPGGSGNIITTGNITASYFIGDGSQLTNLPLATNSTPGVVALGNGFTLNSSNQVTTSSLYNTNLTQPTQHYALSVDTNGVVVLPDQSIINGSTLRAVAGGYAGLTTNDGENSWMWVDSAGAYIATQYNQAGNSHQWTFGTDGRLTFPGTPRIDTDSDNFEVQAAESISLEANAVVNIYTDSSGNAYQWQFGDDGSLTLPIGVSIDNNVDPLYPKIIADSGKLFSVQGQGNTGSAALAWTVDPDAAGQYAAVSVSRAGGDNLAKVVLQAQSDSGNVATAKTWKFDETGNLTLPGNLVIAGNTNVFGTVSALIQPADDLPLIALSSGANGAVSSVWVEDIANVGTSNIAAVYANPVPGSGNVRIAVGQNGVGSGPNLWDFDTAGTLTLPGGSRIRPLGANLDIFAGTGSYVNLITTDESTSMGVDGGGGYITTAGGTWDFDTTGNLTLPSGGNLIVSGAIVSSGASPAPYISGFSSITLSHGAVIKDTAGDAVAFGENAGLTSQGNNAVAIGSSAGSTSQGDYAVSMGYLAGQNTQGTQAVAIGLQTGGTSQGAGAVALGTYSGRTGQGISSVAIGYLAGNTTQGNNSVAMGRSAGETTQGTEAVAIGLQAGFTAQGNYAVAIGKFSANSNQGTYAVAVGPNAGFENQLANAVAIGSTAGASSQGINSVAVGVGAAYNTQGNNAVAVGNFAGYLLQGLNSVAIGTQAGQITQGEFAVAIGDNAGNNAQGTDAVAIGASAGLNTQGNGAVSLGQGTGEISQGANAVALGKAAGQVNQGINSVAIGQSAGLTNQGNNSIILNATGSALDQTTANTFTVAPVRNDVANVAQVMFYNTTSKEITYGNTISVAGNVTGNYFIGNGSQLTNVATSTTGSWTLAAGTNTVSFTIPNTGTYSLWINGNIPNGIVTYTATIVLTNNNVPVVGSSYGWYYEAGNALVLTAIPDHVVGTNNAISNAVVVTTTANTFTFGITNNSGNSVVVNYGYTKL